MSVPQTPSVITPNVFEFKNGEKMKHPNIYLKLHKNYFSDSTASNYSCSCYTASFTFLFAINAPRCLWSILFFAASHSESEHITDLDDLSNSLMDVSTVMNVEFS